MGALDERVAPGGAGARVAPRWRGRLHQLAAVAALPAGAVLVGVSPPAARPAAIVYSATMIGMFSVSAAYHRGAWTDSARRRMKRADHIAIFAFIAGSYTIFSTLMLPVPWRWLMMAVVWLGAVIGSGVKLRRLDRPGGLADVWYLAVGWAGVSALPYLARVAAPAEVGLLVAGGVLYSAGAAALGARRPDPAPAVFGYHEVGHALIVAGVVCHYVLHLSRAAWA